MSPDKPGDDANAITPLEGEAGIPNVTQAKTNTLSKKGIVAVALLVLSLGAVSALSINRALSSGKKDSDEADAVGERLYDLQVALDADRWRHQRRRHAKPVVPVRAEQIVAPFAAVDEARHRSNAAKVSLLESPSSANKPDTDRVLAF